MSHKFSCKLAEVLYVQASDGFVAESIGSVDELGWYGLFLNDAENGEGFGGHILNEDSLGFVTLWSFDNETELVSEWSDIEHEYEEFYAGSEDVA